MWPFSRKVADTKPGANGRRDWIGKEIIARRTSLLEVNEFGKFVPTKIGLVQGRVTDISNKCVKINNTWYELDRFQIGGIEVIEVIEQIK